MGNCKTCRWWTPFGDFKDQETTARQCRAPALIDIDGHRQGYAAVKGDWFGLDYPVCDLVTGPDFGCVHHEEAAK